jgi:Pvc16 N-terminal domain
MSDYRAIAAVSKTLQNLLSDRMEDLTANPVTVTLAPPDVTITGISGRRLNLYLFEVAENGSLKNQELPGNGNPGAYGRPPLSLDLHYLMTAYAQSDTALDSDLTAQQVLGNAMRVLHDYAIVPPDLRQKDDPTKPVLLDPVLAAEYERVKITLQPASVEELSKIWTAIPHANFRRSVIYQVSVVQIESRHTGRLARPVKKRRLGLTLSRRPEIAAVYRTPMAGEPSGDPRLRLLGNLTITGHGFLAVKTWVRLGRLEPLLAAPVDDETLRIDVPDDRYPIDPDHPATRPIPQELRLQPGAQPVEVLTRRVTEGVEGGLGTGHTFADANLLVSNQSFFQLVPEIATVLPPQGKATDTLTLTGKRLYVPGRTTFVLVGDAALRVPDPDPALPPPPSTGAKVSLAPLATALPVPPATGQDYPVRVLVDGAQNLEDTFHFKLLPP